MIAFVRMCGGILVNTNIDQNPFEAEGCEFDPWKVEREREFGRKPTRILCWTAFRTLCGQLNGFDISFCYCSAASNGTAFRGAPGATGRVIYLRLVRFVPAQQRCCYGGRSLCLNQTVRSCTNFSSGQGSGRTCVPTLFVAMFLFLHL